MAVLCLGIVGGASAWQPRFSGVPAGVHLYVAPMEWNLDRFVVDEVRRQALPVQLVQSAEEADFVMTCLYQPLGSHLIAPGHYIQVRVVSVSSGSAVWADEVNDFAIVFGRLRPHGPRRAARSIVRKMRARLLETAATAVRTRRP